MTGDWLTILFKAFIIAGVLGMSTFLIKLLFDNARGATPTFVKEVIRTLIVNSHYAELLERSDIPVLTRRESELKTKIYRLETDLEILGPTDNSQQTTKELGELRLELAEIRTKITAEQERLKQNAEEYASKLLDDINVQSLGLGQTPVRSLVLEYMTVLLIVAGVVVLAVIGILTGEQLAPILASVAGYVLGRSHSSRQGEV